MESEQKNSSPYAKLISVRVTHNQKTRIDDYVALRLKRDDVKLSVNAGIAELLNAGLKQLLKEEDQK